VALWLFIVSDITMRNASLITVLTLWTLAFGPRSLGLAQTTEGTPWSDRLRNEVPKASASAEDELGDLQGSYVYRAFRRDERSGAQSERESKIDFAFSNGLRGACWSRVFTAPATELRMAGGCNAKYIFEVKSEKLSKFALTNYQELESPSDGSGAVGFAEARFRPTFLRHVIAFEVVGGWRLSDIVSGRGGRIAAVRETGSGANLRLTVSAECSQGANNGRAPLAPTTVVVDPAHHFRIEHVEREIPESGLRMETHVHYRDDVGGIPFPESVEVSYYRGETEVSKEVLTFDKPSKSSADEKRYFLAEYGLPEPAATSHEPAPGPIAVSERPLASPVAHANVARTTPNDVEQPSLRGPAWVLCAAVAMAVTVLAAVVIRSWVSKR
jgi:hypothetical protein